jgi:hypothetical protein
MAAPIDVYYLVKFAPPPVDHPPYLLLKLTQAEYANWSQTQEDAAVADVIQRRDQIIGSLVSQIEPSASPATAEVVGEFQGYPDGDAFYEETDRQALDVWVAPTRFGHYWIVLGIAVSEEAFWQKIAEDEDAAGLGPTRPARQLTVRFLNRGARWKLPG